MGYGPSAALDDAVTEQLKTAPAGISEYELIKALREQADELGLPAGSLAEPLVLFRTHFLVYHTLYRLRERWWAEESAHLEISPLCITLRSYAPGTAGVTAHDPLREFYMDLSQLEDTTEADVADWLADFWKRLQAGDQRRQALAVLGLEDPVDYDTIKYRYRQLAMTHHPDRGGDHEQLQAINDAMAVLDRCYG